MRRRFYGISLLLVVTLIVLPACKAIPSEPAKFELTSLNITPSEVAPREPVTITVEVRNSGGSVGT